MEGSTDHRAHMPRLTPKQSRLKQEIEDIAEFIGMDHWNIADYEEEARTPKLQIMKNQLVRGEIIMKYALIDELLTVIICHHYFKKPKKGFSFISLWKTKRFQIFNYYILDDVYLLQKLRVAHAIAEIPAPIRNAIERVNALRNSIAHSFFPENRRQYISYKKVIYRDADIFTKLGVEKFSQDLTMIEEYLFERAGWA
jgi:hypothetical protein